MKKILVIGGSSGIGNAIVQMCAKEAMIYASYHKKPQTSTENIQYFPFSVTEQEASFSFLEESLDALVYCPGTIQLKPFARITEQELLHDYQVNVTGAVKCIQASLPFLKKSKHPSILMFSTVAVQLGMPYHSIVASSKGAVEGLVKALAAELAPTVRVNCIAPSITPTPLAEHLLSTEEKIAAAANRHPLKRIGDVNEIASLAKFLLSDDSNWITGQILHIDGGMSTLKL